MFKPFVTHTFRFATDEDEDDGAEQRWGLSLHNRNGDNDTVTSDHSDASLFSIEGDVGAEASAGGGERTTTSAPPMSAASASDDASVGSTKSGASGAAASAAILINPVSAAASSSNAHAPRHMIPIPMIEAELDLEQDQRHIQEEMALSGMVTQTTRTKLVSAAHRLPLPHYSDPVIALRILVECLAQLKRMDHVERVLLDHVQQEIRLLVQREQARTFARMEKRTQSSILFTGKTVHLKYFRRHLTGLLSAFGCVLLRLSHLAEFLRFRIVGFSNVGVQSRLLWIGNPFLLCTDLPPLFVLEL